MPPLEAQALVERVREFCKWYHAANCKISAFEALQALDQLSAFIVELEETNLKYRKFAIEMYQFGEGAASACGVAMDTYKKLSEKELAGQEKAVRVKVLEEIKYGLPARRETLAGYWDACIEQIENFIDQKIEEAKNA